MADQHSYGSKAARHAADITRRSDTLLDSSTGTPVPWAPVGSALLLLLGGWLWVSFPLLSLPSNALGWNTSLRDEVLAAVLVLSGLVLHLFPRNTPAAFVAVLAGLALIAVGAWAPHGVERSAVNEVVTGMVAVVAVVCAKAPR